MLAAFYIPGSNNGSFSSHLDSVGTVSAAQSVLSMTSSMANHDVTSRSRSRLLMHADSQSSDFSSSGNESTTALLHHHNAKRSQSRDEISLRHSSRSVSRYGLSGNTVLFRTDSHLKVEVLKLFFNI